MVSDYQLSLAIGKEGQNARLAARLTGWRIDIKSETQLAEEEAGYAGQEWAEGEWVENEAGEMVWKPAEGGDAISAEEWTHAAEEQARGRLTRTPAGDRRAAAGTGDRMAEDRRRPSPRPRSSRHPWWLEAEAGGRAPSRGSGA